MVECKKCHHDCHCDGELHADEYGLCACEDCECKNKKDKAEDKSFENEGGLVIDDTGECESCQ
jgi:hypothetical protein|tara:strand:+ start:367 stop:555 length:189 start_codon:yes stop_codon:yes gene_type:complete